MNHWPLLKGAGFLAGGMNALAGGGSEGLLVGAGAIVGGYGRAHAGRRLPATRIRAATILLAAAITALFFVRGYR